MGDHLSTYLNDHFAGSTGGLELARRAAESNDGTELGTVLSRIAAEIDEDRAVLKSVMDALEIQENPVKAATAWAGEKAARLKPNDMLTGYSPLSQMVELEGLSLGIEGKRMLWLVLAERSDPRLTAFDFPELARRAERQRGELEPYRRSAAATAFSDTAPERSTS